MKNIAGSHVGWILLSGLFAACGPQGGTQPAAPAGSAPSLIGDWRAVLASPGGELPFTLRVADAGGELRAVAVNGEEEVPFSGVEREGARVVFHFSWYDSEITADVDASGDSMSGTWRKTIPGGDSTLPFSASRGAEERFLAPATDGQASSAVDSVGGVWAAEFTDEDGSEVARAELEQIGSRVTGTFLTPTGDYRYLEGSFESGLLRLSTFDGAHAFLFQARAGDDGTLVGDFWSRDTYRATWIARRAADEETILPDAWSAVGLTNDDGTFSFRFPDLAGDPLALDDPRFADKVVLVNIFGSWCPNCNDEAPLLADWHRRYRDQGLEIVGLAYEFSGDPERDRVQVRRFAERYGIEYLLLLAGVSDKAEAASTLPDLTAVIAYPTTVFIGRDGKVRKIHSGFSGPGTGEHYERLVSELEGLIEELLAEPAKPG